jgi:putative endonuclease
LTVQKLHHVRGRYQQGALYTGVTSDLVRRVWEHREGVGSAFVRQHRVTRLVWYAHHTDALEAMAHERRLKRWRRAWKITLIETENPDWRDLTFDLTL